MRIFLTLILLLLTHSYALGADLNKQETKDYIVKLVKACKEVKYTDPGEPGFEHMEYFQTASSNVSFSGGNINIIMNTQTIKNNKSQGRIYYESPTYTKSDFSGAIKDLDPNVEIQKDDSRNINFVVIKCSSPGCFTRTTTGTLSDITGEVEKDTMNASGIIVCFSNEAEKLSKALNHLITLYGGKASPF